MFLNIYDKVKRARCRNFPRCARMDYAKFFSRSHDAVIRVYDHAGNVIETHEHKGRVQRVGEFTVSACSRRPALIAKFRRIAVRQLNEHCRRPPYTVR